MYDYSSVGDESCCRRTASLNVNWMNHMDYIEENIYETSCNERIIHKKHIPLSLTHHTHIPTFFVAYILFVFLSHHLLSLQSGNGE